MITKIKKSVSISSSLLEDLAEVNRNMNISQFVETALAFYINELKKQERRQCDIKIINANRERFNKEAEENLEFQDAP
nr:type II toxin-antitoxin system CcdA family antitoxin [Treponema sp.]MCL2237325.1 type II toxin-antitoxin system CcdA family antitoxin [Treponema sp.]